MIRIATALADPAVEADVVRASSGRRDLEVVRRCRDVVEARAVAVTGQVDAIVIDAALRGLDREVVQALGASGVRLVVLTPAGAERLARLGAVVLSAEGPTGIAAALARCPAPPQASPPVAAGRIVAVWGPSGAPGRTTVAVELAAALCRRGLDTLLVDADTVGPSVGQQLGLVDDVSGVAAAARVASAEPLAPDVLAGLAVSVPSGPRVLVGLPTATRWNELRPAAWGAVLDGARGAVPVTVVDVGYALEADDEGWAEPGTPGRFGAAVATLAAADVLVCVGRSDPVGLVRLARELPRARDLTPTAALLLVMNRAGGGRDRTQVEQVVAELLELPVTTHVPDDGKAARAALAHGLTFAEAHPRSPVVPAVEAVAARVHELSGSYDQAHAQLSGAHRRLLRSAHRRHRRRDARLV